MRPSVVSGVDRGPGWALIEAAQGGDRDAFGQLYARYASGVSRFVGARLRDRGAVEDLTSETFVRALRRIDSVSDRGRDVGAWFTTIARNLVLDHVKSSRHRLETVTAAPPDPGPGRGDRGPEQVAIDNDTAAELHRHIACLPAAQRECITRRFLDELSVAETATVMDRNEGAVKALQHRAIVGLRAALTDNTASVPPPADAPDRLASARRSIGEVTHHPPLPPAGDTASGVSPAQRARFTDKPAAVDPMISARRAVAEVAQHVAGDNHQEVTERQRAAQLTRWHADDQLTASGPDSLARDVAGGAA